LRFRTRAFIAFKFFLCCVCTLASTSTSSCRSILHGTYPNSSTYYASFLKVYNKCSIVSPYPRWTRNVIWIKIRQRKPFSWRDWMWIYGIQPLSCYERPLSIPVNFVIPTLNSGVVALVHLRGELFHFLLLCHWRLPWRGRWRRIRHLQLLH